MRRVVIVLVMGVILGFVAGECVPLYVKIWSGDFPLTVHIECAEGQPRQVTCQAHFSRDNAEAVAAHRGPLEDESWSAVVDPYDGKPVVVRVAQSGRESPLGREIARMQFQYLAVIVTLPDGRRVGKVVAIPDNRISREVVVTFP